MQERYKGIIKVLGNAAIVNTSLMYVTCLKRNEALEAYAPPLDWENCSWTELLSAAEGFAAEGNGGRGLYFLLDSRRFPAWYAQ